MFSQFKTSADVTFIVLLRNSSGDMLKHARKAAFVHLILIYL